MLRIPLHINSLTRLLQLNKWVGYQRNLGMLFILSLIWAAIDSSK
jgi:hypothetical protein